MICERVSAVRCLRLCSGMTRSSVSSTSRSAAGLSDHGLDGWELKSLKCLASKKPISPLFRSLDQSYSDSGAGNRLETQLSVRGSRGRSGRSTRKLFIADLCE